MIHCFPHSQMNYEASQALSHSQFKRRFGVQRATFKRMLKGLSHQLPQVKLPGRPHKLSIENQILVALEYWREYHTYFHISTAFIFPRTGPSQNRQFAALSIKSKPI